VLGALLKHQELQETTVPTRYFLQSHLLVAEAEAQESQMLLLVALVVVLVVVAEDQQALRGQQVPLDQEIRLR
jgi:hypothetical protein